jgi:hypothetical protein
MKLSVLDIAGVCHEANRALCKRLGDNSQPRWEEAPPWQRDSAIDGVRFHLATPDATPDASHENWLKMKIAEGWQYGPVKDPAKKEHPCCVPYEQLPIEQRAKDYLFKGVMEALRPLHDGNDL